MKYMMNILDDWSNNLVQLELIEFTENLKTVETFLSKFLFL